MWNKFCTATIAALLLVLSASGSIYDPHVPSAGSFFEGWYTRIATADGNSSFAVMFGMTHAKDSVSNRAPRAMITITYQDNNNPAASMQAFSEFPDPFSVAITRNGSAIIHNPDYKSSPNFRWDAGELGYHETIGHCTVMNFTVGGISFYAETISVTPWTSDGSGFGPAGPLDSLPIPLHWFVYSLSSTVASYSFSGGESKVAGFGGRAHMEKNWGHSFPNRWVWAEAMDCTDSSTAFAFSGGDLSLWGKSLAINSSHLAGYRSRDKQLAWSFTPADSLLNATIDACSGLFSFDLIHNFLPRRLSVFMIAPAASLCTCLWGPAAHGFAPMSTESFLATVEVTAYKRLFDGYEILDRVVMPYAALEFGGAYRCRDPDPCQQQPA
jgi:hypothetical protein